MKPAAVAEHRGALNNARLIAALVAGGNYDELMDVAGLSYHTVMRYCKALKIVGHAFIHHYDLDAKDVASRPFWKFCLTPTKDAKRPQRSKEQLAKYRRELRAAKRKQAATSAFTFRPPRYAEGSRLKGAGCENSPSTNFAAPTASVA